MISKIYLTYWEAYDKGCHSFIRFGAIDRDEKVFNFYAYVENRAHFKWHIRGYDESGKCIFYKNIFSINSYFARKKCDKILLATGRYELISFERAEKLKLLL